MHSLTITSISIAAAITTLASPLAAQTASHPSQSTHVVAKGETLWRIAQRYQTSVGELMEYNNLSSHIVREGSTLKIPGRVVVAPGKPAPTPAPRQRTEHAAIHLVRDGETFWRIAEKYGISSEALAKANPNINPNRIHKDMELYIPAGSSNPAVAKRRPTPDAANERLKKPNPNSMPVSKVGFTEHVLVEGETFYSLSRTYGVKLDDLIAANPHLKPERLRTGTKISIPLNRNKWTDNGNKSTKPANPTPPQTSGSKPVLAANASQQPVRHVVAEDESIASIAKKYSLSTDELLKHNNLKETDAIFVDDVLIIPIKGQHTPKVADTNPKPVENQSTPKPQNTVSSTSTNKENSSTQLAAAKPEVTAPKPKPQPIQYEVAPDGSVRSYIISAGETEETICEAFGISKKELFEHNKLPLGAKLRPGDEIMIPATTKTVVSR